MHSFKLSFILISLVLNLGACATTQDESRILTAEESSGFEKYLGSYTGNIFSKKTRNPDAKPLVSGVKLLLELKDQTLVVTSDKDLDGGECKVEAGRLTSVNFSAKSAIATFAIANSRCVHPLNIAEISLEFSTSKDGERRLYTKLPRRVKPGSDQTGKLPSTLFGVFTRDDDLSYSAEEDVVDPLDE